MANYFHGRVFCHLPAWKLLSMRALSPRRRRCSPVLQRDSRVLAAMFFYGVLLWHCGTTRSVSKRLFLPTFSGKAEKVGLRSNGCGVTAKEASPVPTGQTGRQSRRPLQAAVQNRPRSNSCGFTAFSGTPVKMDEHIQKAASASRRWLFLSASDIM